MKKKRAGYLEGVVAIVVNVSLFFLKLWAGIVSGSVALMADAWHTLTDSVSSLIVLVGAHLSAKKPDKKYPFGYGRWEQVASVFIAVILALVAFDFLLKAVEGFQQKREASFGVLAITVTVVSILAKEGLARYAFYLSRRSGNLMVKADAWHHRSDALSSILILLGIALSPFFWWIDSLLAAVIAMFLFYAVFTILKESVNAMIGKKPSPELHESVCQIIRETAEDALSPHDFLLHEYGSHRELTFHIQFHGEDSITCAHDKATCIEERILDELDIYATIHLEPYGAD